MRDVPIRSPPLPFTRRNHQGSGPAARVGLVVRTAGDPRAMVTASSRRYGRGREAAPSPTSSLWTSSLPGRRSAALPRDADRGLRRDRAAARTIGTSDGAIWSSSAARVASARPGRGAATRLVDGRLKSLKAVVAGAIVDRGVDAAGALAAILAVHSTPWRALQGTDWSSAAPRLSPRAASSRSGAAALRAVVYRAHPRRRSADDDRRITLAPPLPVLRAGHTTGTAAGVIRARSSPATRGVPVSLTVECRRAASTSAAAPLLPGRIVAFTCVTSSGAMLSQALLGARLAGNHAGLKNCRIAPPAVAPEQAIAFYTSTFGIAAACRSGCPVRAHAGWRAALTSAPGRSPPPRDRRAPPGRWSRRTPASGLFRTVLSDRRITGYIGYAARC